MTLVNRVVLFFGTIVLILGTITDTSSQSGVVRIRPSGGLNTIADDFTMPLEDARVAHEIDFSANIGGITVRKGYDSVSAIPTNWDSLVSIYGAYYSDGSQQLFAVADSAGVGYGNVIFGAKGSSSLSSPTVAMGYWSVQNKTKFAMLDDRVYAVNGQQKGFVWDGRHAQRWPLQAPGEPSICPLNTPGNLNGEYRYVIAPYSLFDGGVTVPTNQRQGATAPPVVVSNGQILLSDFTFPMSDSFAQSVDSAHFHVYRTKANIAPLDAADTAYKLPNVYLRSIGNSMATFYENNSDVTPQSTLTDNIADASLTSDSGWTYAIHSKRVGRMQSGLSPTKFGSTGQRYGAPTYLSKVDSGLASPSGSVAWNDTIHHTGLFFGIRRGVKMAGWAWVVSLVDTINSIESDTTRSLFVLDTFTMVPADTALDKPFSITIGLPRVASSVTQAMKNIYRAPVYIMGHDTTFFDTLHNTTSIKYLGAPFSPLLENVAQAYFSDIRAAGIRIWQHGHLFDSLYTGQYYKVATVPLSDTSFTDNIRYDSLVKKDIYRYTTPPLFGTIFPFEGRMYGTSKSRLYYSVLDSVTRWGALSSISVNENDGDIITTAFPARGVLRVLKNRSNYNIFQGPDLGWNRTEVSGYFGCIAPNSHVATINGHYYVSDIGVIRETEGPNLERTQSIENVSAKLKQFADFSVEDARKINAFAIPSEGKVLFSKDDTTYVYDERANAWATWGMTFSDATLYGAENTANFIPGDSMYFIKSGSRTLFRYGSGDSPLFHWESAPFGLETSTIKQVGAVGVWSDNFTASFGVTAAMINEKGVTVTASPVSFGTAINGMTRFSWPSDTTTSIYHRLRVAGYATGSLRAFDIYQKDIGETEER